MKHRSAVDSLIEEATLDCYGEEECRMGFAEMLAENLKTPFDAMLNGRVVTVIRIDDKNDRIIKAGIRCGKVTFPVDILDLQIDRNVKGSEWIAAYRKWEIKLSGPPPYSSKNSIKPR